MGAAGQHAAPAAPRGWLKDRYALSWQIMPVRQTELLNDPDEAAAQRVMSAMLQMTKLDILAPRLPIHGNQPEGAGPSRITPRTWSTDTPSHGNSTIHHVAPADA